LCAVRALRKRRGRQSDRHQRCGNKRFVVHDRCFPGYGCCPSEPCVTRPARDARVIAEFGSPRFGGGLFSRGDNPLSRLGLMRFSKRLTDLIGGSSSPHRGRGRRAEPRSRRHRHTRVSYSVPEIPRV
jgi:hypothetical protein